MILFHVTHISSILCIQDDDVDGHPEKSNQNGIPDILGSVHHQHLIISYQLHTSFFRENNIPDKTL